VIVSCSVEARRSYPSFPLVTKNSNKPGLGEEPVAKRLNDIQHRCNPDTEMILPACDVAHPSGLPGDARQELGDACVHPMDPRGIVQRIH